MLASKNSTLFGLIYDMDNTILASKIDFNKMKQVVLSYVQSRFKVNHQGLSCGQIIDLAVSLGLTPQEEAELWQMVSDIETAGMVDAKAEPGALMTLQWLQNHFQQFILTNNTLAAAKVALEHTNLTRFFAKIYGREQVATLKPSPAGIKLIQQEYPQIKKWFLIGDSWLDGVAAANAQIPFAAYGNKPASYWAEYNVTPQIYLSSWTQDYVSSILEEFAGKSL